MEKTVRGIGIINSDLFSDQFFLQCTRVQKQDLRNTGQCLGPVYQSPEAGPQKYRSVSKACVPESSSRTSEIQVSVLVPCTRVQKQDLKDTGQYLSPVYQSPEAGPQKCRSVFLTAVSPVYQSPEEGPQKYRSVFLTQSVPCTRVQKQDLRNTGQYFDSVSTAYRSPEKASQITAQYFNSVTS